MKVVQISASPKQLSRLRNGHNVRITAGSGINLVVHPDRFDVISKAFRLSKGINVKLSPDELQANKETIIDGSGLYKALSKAGIKKRGVVNAFKTIGKDALKIGAEAVKTGLMAYGAPPEVMGMVDNLERKGERAIQRGNTKQFKPKPGQSLNIKNLAGKVGMELLDRELDNFDPRYRDIAELALDTAQNKPFESSYDKFKQNRGFGLYVGRVSGGATNIGPKGQQMSVVNRELPAALQSQNNAANFQMASRLPPQYAKIIMAGNGLYL